MNATSKSKLFEENSKDMDSIPYGNVFHGKV